MLIWSRRSSLAETDHATAVICAADWENGWVPGREETRRVRSVVSVPKRLIGLNRCRTDRRSDMLAYLDDSKGF